MTAGLQTRPGPAPPGAPVVREPAAGPPPPTGDRRVDLLLAVVALLAAACLPFGRVFVGWAFLRPVLGAVLVAVGLSWGCRRFGAGPVTALAVSAVGWALFVTAAFLPGTAALGILPTTATLAAFPEMWAQGVELIGARPAPVFADPALLLLTVTGVWAVSFTVEGTAFRLQAPVKAVVLALGLWMVPLVITAGEGSPGAWAAPFLAAAALVLLLSAEDDVRCWGGEVTPRVGGAGRGRHGRLFPSGALQAGIAIVVGIAVAGMLPGFGAPPWYEFRGVGGTTLTTNPIVTIRHSLVATDEGPIMQVDTPRPVYLRTTSLDLYSEAGEWTNRGIRGTPLEPEDGGIRPETFDGQDVEVDVEVVNLPDAVLVPAPYQPQAVSGPAASDFRYDERLATLTTDRGVTLQRGDRYTVSSVLPDPDPDALRQSSVPVRDEHVQLPGNVPAEVRDLAQSIVREAGADTPFEQALALQDEFQSWEYSLDPPPGHGGDAMLSFIDSRKGYCEQYAGTMAVMLRTLGVPARVAVGFTPGEVIGEDTYQLTNGNAHAWVEVLFPRHGWVAFEPTPRDDGNVLTPSAQNLAPTTTVAEEIASEPVDVPETSSNEEFLPQPGDLDPSAPDGGSGGSEETGAADEDGGPGWLLVTLLTGLVGVGAAAAAVHRRHRTTAAQPAPDRVLAARRRVARLGRGLRVVGGPWETDLEYLQRLASVPGGAAHSPAGTLADLTAQARYAPDLPTAAAEEAESAADALHTALLADRSALGRAAVLTRGRVSAGLASARAVLARRGR